MPAGEPPAYAELHALSSFSFFRGASHPEELVARAAALGYAALALTDEASVAGAVRAHRAAREAGLQLILGSELALAEGPRLVLLAPDREAWGDLCQILTRARRRAPKGRYLARRADLEELGGRCLILWLPEAGTPEGREGREGREEEAGRWVAETFPGRAWLAVARTLAPGERERLARLEALGRRLGLPRVAATGALLHHPARRPLADAFTALRLGTTVAAAGLALAPNGERHLRPRQRLARLYPAPWLAETLAVARRCRFSLEELRYEYPAELVPRGHSPASWLRRLTEEGMARRWPGGPPARVRELVERELALIAELGYEPYFLTVHELVAFARSRGILCQGRGSAANSAVCYSLGITEVDPARLETLFERFVSKERGEPPDIDVDFEHERREEVLQHLYRRYGRERAALACTVITYRPRSAVRDAARALGLDGERLQRLAAVLPGWEGEPLSPRQLREAGLDPASPVSRRLVALARSLLGHPRHLSQHVGGMVISAGPLERLVPIENAAMPGRTVIQWDKDDLESLGLLKVDVLGLGMLTALRKALHLVSGRRGRPFTLADIPPEDPETYRMIRRADTVGVFQIESRAQRAMLPRLRPRCFYDLVVQVAIVRPGPIQGEMVHPYLRRRQGLEPVHHPSPEVEAVLGRTLGVPIFQEQVIKLAMVAAGFSAGEADRLRRAMGAWRRKGELAGFRRRLLEGMRARGYPEAFARQIFQQILGFGEYGFPESHAASFALLAYASAWLKRHEPEAFLCALLNSQPMGFYPPDQLVRDARAHGVAVRPVSVTASAWDCTLEEPSEREGEEGPAGRPTVRLGLRLVKGLGRAAAERLCRARAQGPFRDVADLARRARLDGRALEALARAGALAPLAG
ncbi:MAG: DNA polymerase III subunit alpha, partial [Gammaproteobacteria bacterium]